MRKADYHKIATFYDKGRFLTEQNLKLWLEIILKYTTALKGGKLLDLGCGTGRFSIPIATKLGFKVTGADSSKEMLDKARIKDTAGLVKWDHQDAQNLTYADNSYDIVFMSHLLHHVENPGQVIRECTRVLATPGVILIRYGAIEQIRTDVEHTLFPEILAIDEARPISVRMVEKWLKDTGFSSLISEEIIQRSFNTIEERIEADLDKGISVLTMISPQAFEKGMRNLRKYVKENADDPRLLYDRMTLTAGYKGRG